MVLLFKWANPGLFFFIFVRLFTTVTVNIQYNFLPIRTGFEPQTAGVGSDCSTNWATNHCPYFGTLQSRSEFDQRERTTWSASPKCSESGQMHVELEATVERTNERMRVKLKEKISKRNYPFWGPWLLLLLHRPNICIFKDSIAEVSICLVREHSLAS